MENTSIPGANTREHRWKELQCGQKVKVAGPTGEEYFGVVDERTQDGAFVWIFTVGSGRRLFHVEDGFDATQL